VELRQSSAEFINVKVHNPEIEVIDRSSLIFALFNAEEGRSHTEDVHFRCLLPKRHSKELLIELGRAVEIGNPYADMVQTDGAKTD
jgi:hypothetical protein